MKIRKLSIIVPVYNEKATIEKVLNKLVRFNPGDRKKEIVIVDDGSSDGTTGVLTKFKVQVSRFKTQGFKFIFKKKNEGKGAAIRTALNLVTGDYVIIQDADLEYNPEEIVKLVKKAEKEDLTVVFGSRDREIKNKYLYPHYYWGSKTLCWFINLIFRETFTDPETCYKLIKTDLLKFINITENGFGVEMEMAAKIARLKIPYGEVAITYHPRSFAEGKKIGIKDGIRAIYLIGKYWEHDLHYGLTDRVLRKIRLREALKFVQIKSGQKLVDMGCGRQAALGWKLRKKLDKYTGLDLEVPNLKLDNIELVPADLNRKLVLEDRSADIIIGTAVLEHLNNPRVFIRECRRILKPGGRLALTTPAPPLADGFLKILVNLRMIEADEVYDHVHYFDINELKGIIDKTGMKVTKAKGFLCGLNNLVIAIKNNER